MVRIWCVPVSEFNRQHLLGEHLELHTILTALQKQKGYFNHPQTQRFNKPTGIGQLIFRHNQQVAEMQRRGYNHKSPINLGLALPVPYTYTKEEYTADHIDLMQRQGAN